MKTAISFLFFLLVACLFSGGKIQKTYPSYQWHLPPSIINCIDKDDMPSEVFEDSVEFWEEHGHTFLFKESYKGDICNSSIPHGFIVIKISYELPFNVLGKTERIYDKNEENMTASVIFLNYAHVEDTIVLIHEIGHALGYKHVDQIGHIMNPMRPNAGLYFY